MRSHVLYRRSSIVDRRAESGGREIGEATRDSPQGQNIFSDQYVLHTADSRIFHSVIHTYYLQKLTRVVFSNSHIATHRTPGTEKDIP